MSEPTDFAMADEISKGMRERVQLRIRSSGNVFVPVVFSTADVLYLLDAYDELRQGVTIDTE